MKPTSEVLATLVARVRLPIPPKPTPKPKPRKSWRGYRVGAHLQHGPFVWEVVECDSVGMELRVVTPYQGTSTMRLTREEDLQDFTKVRKPRKPKAKKEPNR